jgi:ATP-dependent metalloprotease FtsH
MKSLIKYVLIVFVVLALLSGVTAIFQSPFSGKKQEITLSQLVTQINNGEVKEIVVRGDSLEISLSGKEEKEYSQKEIGISLAESLVNFGADKTKLSQISVDIKSETGALYYLSNFLPIILPFLFVLLIFWLMFRQAQRGAMTAFTFGKSKARLAGDGDGKKKITFKDVAGLVEAKEEVSEVVEFLKDPKKFLKLGARMPRGVLLVGSPGTGKTLLAKAVANEANVPFYHMSGSDFIEMFVGVGASVVGETPVLIKTLTGTRLMPIKKFVDRYYGNDQEGYVGVNNVQTLGFTPAETNFRGFKKSKDKLFFGKAAWKNIKGVYRHKANKIFEIEYLGGKIRITGDHSVFIREKNHISARRASELRPGDILVDLPFKVRGAFISGLGTIHKIKTFVFPEKIGDLATPIWEENKELAKKYNFAIASRGVFPQWQIGQMIGASQMSVSEWQRGVCFPAELSPKIHKKRLLIPQTINISPDLMRLLGYYLAEGRTTSGFTEFTFGIHETEFHKDCIELAEKIFRIKPRLSETEDNTLKITMASSDIARFFERLCNTGSHNKKLPEFIWDLPYLYFVELLKGYGRGDGYITKQGKLSITSVSKQLITELAWLCSMHGIKPGIKTEMIKPGRVIKKKALPGGRAWTLIIGKTSNPFIDNENPEKQFKKPAVKKITELPYNDYVYDLCGCDNEAFFGGEKPVLLHNSRVRDTFETAKKTAPSIIFIDELDAIGRHRGAGLGGGHDEREQTLNQILVEMDGFDTNEACIVMAATNRPDILDPALLRPGRFDRRIILDEPTIRDREEILKIHAVDKPLAKSVNLKLVAERTPGFSGADLANLINEAALLAARKNQKEIEQENLFQAIEKVILGPERKTHIFSKKEKEVAAYHEAGHAIVAASVPHSDPVHKVSIVSRGRAGGYTLKLPSEDKHLRSRSEFEAELAVLLSGYTAERLVFNELTTGASNDLKVASELARKMVTQYGMSDKLGPITYGDKDELVFLGKELSTEKNYSEETAKMIDAEVKKLISNAFKKATEVLSKKSQILKKVADELIAKETLEQKEFYELIKG